MSEWSEDVFDSLVSAKVRQIAYVPDMGLKTLIDLCIADDSMTAVPLTTEEEGVALACGAWAGGKKTALLMQSSGVGNCINMLALVKTCRFPFLTLVTMRGEWEEFNPWQEPMGAAVPAVLEAMDVEPRRISEPEEVAPMISTAADDVFGRDRAVALLISQKLIGKKVW